MHLTHSFLILDSVFEELVVQYFIKRNEKVNGPFTAAQVKSERAKGQLQPTDLVGTDQKGPWKPLSQTLGKSSVPATADKGDADNEDVIAWLEPDNAADELDRMLDADSSAKEVAEYDREQQLIAEDAKQLAQERVKQLTQERAKANSRPRESRTHQMASHSQQGPASNRTRLFVGIGAGVVAVAIGVIVAFNGNKDDKQDAVVQSDNSHNAAATAPAQRFTPPAEGPPSAKAEADPRTSWNKFVAALSSRTGRVVWLSNVSGERMNSQTTTNDGAHVIDEISRGGNEHHHFCKQELINHSFDPISKAGTVLISETITDQFYDREEHLRVNKYIDKINKQENRERVLRGLKPLGKYVLAFPDTRKDHTVKKMRTIQVRMTAFFSDNRWSIEKIEESSDGLSFSITLSLRPKSKQYFATLLKRATN